MTEEDRKFLTEELGECWHEWNPKVQNGSLSDNEPYCLKCNYNSIYGYNRTFVTPDDFFAVWNHMKTRDDWPDFYAYCEEQSRYRSSREQFVCWLVDTFRFPELAVEWLRKENPRYG